MNIQDPLFKLPLGDLWAGDPGIVFLVVELGIYALLHGVHKSSPTDRLSSGECVPKRNNPGSTLAEVLESQVEGETSTQCVMSPWKKKKILVFL